MKKFLIVAIFLFEAVALFAGGMPTIDKGFTSFQYEVIDSTGVNNITWPRRVNKITVTQISTHTIYLDFFEVQDSSAAVADADPGSTASPYPPAHAIDRVIGMASTRFPLDGEAAVTTTFNVESNDFSVYVSTDNPPLQTVSLRIYAWGW